MGKYILAYDLGTGGNKASLFDIEGNCRAETFVAYPTLYPKAGWHEQRPQDWWQAIIKSTRTLIKEANIDRNEIICCGISGHSLGVVPIEKSGNLLRESTPIWSDSRATVQAEEFFKQISERDWYLTTGNGFPRALYSVFKIMWYRDQEPRMFERIYKVLGTKDLINYYLTGQIATDYSYASGSGIYDLTGWKYSDELLSTSGLAREIFPEIYPSTTVIGSLTDEAAEILGLPSTIKVVAGGVDNSCMALGARNIKEGRIYESQGSSSWIAVTSSQPLLDLNSRPFVFTHVIPELFTSATGAFSTGSSFRWVRDILCKFINDEEGEQGGGVYDRMTSLAAESCLGANGLLFNPNLAGGSSLHDSPNIRGAFLGIDLGHSLSDVLRATMEGVALETRLILDALRRLTPINDEMIVVGGGSRSKLWRQIHADVYNLRIIKTNIDQQAAALGAAALGAVGAGLWDNFEIIDEIHKIEDVTEPIPENNAKYEKLLEIYLLADKHLSDIGDRVRALNL